MDYVLNYTNKEQTQKGGKIDERKMAKRCQLLKLGDGYMGIDFSLITPFLCMMISIININK